VFRTPVRTLPVVDSPRIGSLIRSELSAPSAEIILLSLKSKSGHFILEKTAATEHPMLGCSESHQ
jgi:hypothetical protein